jgi:hypothetical protein
MRELLVSLLVVNAMFLCLLPHSIHCDFIKNITNRDCPPHIILIILGLSSFILAVIIAQQEYIDEIIDIAKKTTQVAGAVVTRVTKISKKAISKFPSVSEVADRVEHFVDKSKSL